MGDDGSLIQHLSCVISILCIIITIKDFSSANYCAISIAAAASEGKEIRIDCNAVRN